MKRMISLFILLSILIYTHSFSILGVWNLKQIKDYPVISETVQMTLEDLIFRQKQVQQIISFKGCRSYKYMAQIVQNNIFINFNTFNQINSTQITNCNRQISLMHFQIQDNLKSVFTFKIFGNNLVFLDAKQNIVLRFQKKSIIKYLNLRGQWNLIRINSRRIQDKIYFTDSQIILCQQKLKFQYNLIGRYQIKTKLKNNNGCISQELQQTLLAINFYRKNNNTLEIYDNKIKLRIQLIFNQDIPQNFNTLPLKNNPINNTIVNSVQNNKLVGKWQPLSIFGMPLSSSPITIIFTENQVFYNGGCNQFTYQYSFNDFTKKINLGKRQSTSNVCQNDEDGLYVNAMWKMTKYIFDINSNLKLVDALGKSLYQLRKINQNQSKQFNVIPQKQKIIISEPLRFQNGKYVFLLSNRRDLPRIFCTINSGKLICDGCNSIQHNYKFKNQNQIQILGQVLGSKICNNDNDKIFSDTLNSANIFEKNLEVQGYNLKDSNNQLVGYLSSS